MQKLYYIKQLNIVSFSFVPLTYSKMQSHRLTTPTDRRHLLTLVISSAFHLPQSNVRIFNVAQGQLCLQAPHTHVCANARTLENSKCRCDDEAHALIDTPIWFGDILCMVFFLLRSPRVVALFWSIAVNGTSFLFARMSFGVSASFIFSFFYFT